MKKILLALCAGIFLLSGCSKKEDLATDKIYYFYSESCGHCKSASSYINTHYPDLEMIKVDVATKAGYDMILKCAQKFKLGNRIGTPLFCMGDRYVMGWSDKDAAKFNAYVKPFLDK